MLIFSCKTEYVEVPVEVLIYDTLHITVQKNSSIYYGGSAYLNGNYREYQGAEYAVSQSELSGIQIASFEWVDNFDWVPREIVTVSNIKGFTIGDTISLSSSNFESSDLPFSNLFYAYGDDNNISDCYGILEEDGSSSWLMILEYDESVPEISGMINANYIISDVCPSDSDIPRSDTVRLRDLVFWASLRE